MWLEMSDAQYCSKSSKINRMLGLLRDEVEDEDVNIEHCLGGLYKLYPKLCFF
jgi:hypothetical protein